MAFAVKYKNLLKELFGFFELVSHRPLFADILDALTQDFFARKGNPIEEPPHVEEVKVRCLFLLTECRVNTSSDW
jgi:hypothetical protein